MKIPFKLKLTLILFFALSTVFIIQVIVVNIFTEKFAIEYENNEIKEYSKLCQKIYFNELELNNLRQLDIELEHFYFQIRDENNKVLYNSPKVKNMEFNDFKLEKSEDRAYYYNETIRGDLFRFYIEKNNINNKNFTFIYFISLDAYLKFVNKINALFIIIFIIIIFILFFISNLFVNKALNPVNKIIDEVNKINIKNLSGRIENVKSNDVLEKLTETFNYMIERLEISFNRINRFFSDFSHEIKNPLAVIKNGIELIGKSEKLSEDDSNIFYRLSEEVEYVQRMTNELLFLAKADYDSIQLKYSSVNLKELVAFCEDIGKIMTDEKQIKFSVNFSEKDLNLFIDEQRIKQVIINLLNNAVEYTKEGGEIKITFLFLN
ncbi:hypothetical protein KA977_06330, partial [Candidatus Dependentiae bacterium]|nr:hypothetical protein [Candidatus Dependentiae bacterium]